MVVVIVHQWRPWALSLTLHRHSRNGQNIFFISVCFLRCCPKIQKKNTIHSVLTYQSLIVCYKHFGWILCTCKKPYEVNKGIYTSCLLSLKHLGIHSALTAGVDVWIQTNSSWKYYLPKLTQHAYSSTYNTIPSKIKRHKYTRPTWVKSIAL